MTAAEIVLALYWAVLTAIWVIIVLSVVSLVIRVVPGEGAWLLGSLILILAVLVTVGFVWRARRGCARRWLARFLVTACGAGCGGSLAGAWR